MKKLFKKAMAVCLAAVMTVGLCSCGQAGNKTLNIAIVKQLDHASLDEIASAIEAQLNELGTQNGVEVKVTVYSGQNDQSTIKQICDQAIAQKVDAIVPIATMAAQVAAGSAQDSKTPVIFAAVSDPKAADLTGFEYVTGTSDGLNTNFIMDMMFTQNPDIKKVGLLYSTSEVNSQTPIEEAKAYLADKNIETVAYFANNNEEAVMSAALFVDSEVDAVFTPTDNVIMAAELAIYETFADAGIPHYAGADSFVRNGAFATCGVNYTELGKKTADLAFKAAREGMEGMEDYYLMDGGIITVNTETAAKIGADISKFNGMGEIVEVTTTEE